MYLLRQKVDFYTGYDRLLGIARSTARAAVLRAQYLVGAPVEPSTVVLEDLTGHFARLPTVGPTVFLVCHLEDYLGICSLRVHRAFAHRPTADTYVQNFHEYCDILQDYDYKEVFEPEKVAPAYLDQLYQQLDTDQPPDYFKAWGGQLVCYALEVGALV